MHRSAFLFGGGLGAAVAMVGKRTRPRAAAAPTAVAAAATCTGDGRRQLRSHLNGQRLAVTPLSAAGDDGDDDSRSDAMRRTPARKSVRKKRASTAPRGALPAAKRADSCPDTSMLENFGSADFQRKLLEWYHVVHRELPWRTSPTPHNGTKKPSASPYAVWVSEVMLQQTRVATVIRYYNRWMQAFPDARALAEAPLERVMELWAGLGYYRRARMLHEGAKLVVERYGGELPRSAAELRSIPGIGEYTAAAVASIAYAEPKAVVDGNVARVLSRQLAVRQPASHRVYWQLADALLPGQLSPNVTAAHPGVWNQAMMDFGARLCTPRAPRCHECPVKAHCRARAEARCGAAAAATLPEEAEVAKYIVDHFPPRKERVAQREQLVAVCVVSWRGAAAANSDDGDSDRLLLTRRPDGGVLAGLWEFPSVDRFVDEQQSLGELEDNAADGAEGRPAALELRSRLRMRVGELLRRAPPPPPPPRGCQMRSVPGELRHDFSHVRQRLSVYCMELEGQVGGGGDDNGDDVGGGGDVRWVRRCNIPRQAVSAQVKKVLKAVMEVRRPVREESEGSDLDESGGSAKRSGGGAEDSACGDGDTCENS